MQHKGKVSQGFYTPYIDGWDEKSRRPIFDAMIYDEAQEWAKEANHNYGYDLDLSSYRQTKVRRTVDAGDKPILEVHVQWRSFRPHNELKLLHQFGELPHAHS